MMGKKSWRNRNRKRKRPWSRKRNADFQHLLTLEVSDEDDNSDLDDLTGVAECFVDNSEVDAVVSDVECDERVDGVM